MQRCCVVVVLALLVAPFDARAEGPSRPVPIDGKCSVAADKHWTPQEKFVWGHVCIGAIADFNEGTTYGGNLDPRAAAGLPESRTLRPIFLETILLDDKYRGAITRHGVRIFGARFKEKIELQNAELQHELWLQGCLLENGADLSWLRSTQPIGFDASKVAQRLNMYGLQVASNLYMNNNSEFAEVDLPGAHVGQTLDLSSSKISDTLNMPGLEVGSDLLMNNEAEFAAVNLPGAHVGKTLDLSSSKISGTLNMPGLEVGSDLLMNNKAEFAEVNLHHAHVGHTLNLDGSTASGELQMYGIRVDTDLFMRGSEFAEVNLANAQIGRELGLGGSSFHKNVDLAGAHIGGAFELGSTHWPKDATLSLRNAKADTIPGLSDAWPDKLDLDGLTYRALGTDGEDFEGWLHKLHHYSPQPYEQLATVLQNHGNTELATAVRYAARDRERRESTGWVGWAWLSLLDWVIGYGYYAYRSIGWALAFVILGAIVLRVSGEGPRNHMPIGLTYSFDMLLPLIRLREKHRDIDLAGPARYYFYGHKILGWVLASFMIAGLSGLTK